MPTKEALHQKVAGVDPQWTKHKIRKRGGWKDLKTIFQREGVPRDDVKEHRVTVPLKGCDFDLGCSCRGGGKGEPETPIEKGRGGGNFWQK